MSGETPEEYKAGHLTFYTPFADDEERQFFMRELSAMAQDQGVTYKDIGEYLIKKVVTFLPDGSPKIEMLHAIKLKKGCRDMNTSE